MRIQVTTPPMIYVAPWLRRYATALIVIALVALATLGAGVAQLLYSNAASQASGLGISTSTGAALDQHERHGALFIQFERPRS